MPKWFYTALNTPYQSVRGGIYTIFSPFQAFVKCIIDQFGLLAINLDSIQRCSVQFFYVSLLPYQYSVPSMLQGPSIKRSPNVAWLLMFYKIIERA